MVFSEFIDRLKIEFSKPLPGKKAQLLMTSPQRLKKMIEPPQIVKVIKSSVLILLYPGKENSQPNFVVTLRPIYNGIHSGQISLPGGQFEFPDKTLMQTALRETHEEIGMNPADVTIIGQLTELYIPPSNYLVQPFVGFTNGYPEFRLQLKEVRQIIELPIDLLLDEKNLMEKEIYVAEIHFFAPSFVINETIIWGATAMILNEFKEILLKIRL